MKLPTREQSNRDFEKCSDDFERQMVNDSMGDWDWVGTRPDDPTVIED